MFSASTDTTLVCPRCRHVSVVGNSVTALKKNFAVLALLHSSSSSSAAANFDCDYTDDEGDGDEEDFEEERCSRGSHASSSGACGPVIDVGAHPEVKLVKKIGEARSKSGMETWTAVIGGGGVHGKKVCRHRVAVKKVEIGEEMEVDWVLGQLESLRKAAMWCRNVCTFHGVVKMDGCLGIVTDRCHGSVESEMQRNEGRLTLEQILRSFLPFRIFFFMLLVKILFNLFLLLCHALILVQ